MLIVIVDHKLNNNSILLIIHLKKFSTIKTKVTYKKYSSLLILENKPPTIFVRGQLKLQFSNKNQFMPIMNKIKLVLQILLKTNFTDFVS